ncbi:hypothetical protein [Paraburkholderia dinghuensis]|uniref:Multidrug ABC transporter ATPase n=1 Tax=Paraburkholderia dinghuensis TaxID=2305225 RepID=A0A3N6MW09_9BURK|nr:hypothetical protein [Paraburkholderia dinghuensis]RQH06145.1 hypothetical protein D1Y85_13285 [Paraburkholderia dinghuensis]
MPYLKNTLGGLGRTFTDTARLAFARANSVRRATGWRKFAVYAAVFALPGGSLAVLLHMWAERRRARRDADAGAASAACCCNALACRAASAPQHKTYAPRTRAGAHALRALRRWRRNDA